MLTVGIIVLIVLAAFGPIVLCKPRPTGGTGPGNETPRPPFRDPFGGPNSAPYPVEDNPHLN